MSLGNNLSLEPQPTSSHTHKVIISHLGDQVKKNKKQKPECLQSHLREKHEVCRQMLVIFFSSCMKNSTVKVEP